MLLLVILPSGSRLHEINYTHPSKQHQKLYHSAMRSHLNKHFARTKRQIVLPTKWTRRWLVVERGTIEDRNKQHDEEIEPATKCLSSHLILEGGPRTDINLCCARADPFDVYPIKASGCVPVAIDFCRSKDTVS